MKVLDAGARVIFLIGLHRVLQAYIPIIRRTLHMSEVSAQLSGRCPDPNLN